VTALPLEILVNNFLTLNNGVRLPPIGFGVFQSAPEETTAAVATALTAGYRHIDTAAGYGNEREVGEAVRRSGLDRDDVVLETKVWVSDYGYDQTLHAFEKSAAKLGVDRIDVLILHQPMPQHFDRTVDAYRALETLLADGRVRAIGVSNFLPHHLTALAQRTEVVPAVNQVELHPYFSQPDVQRANAALGVLTQAWSPIGGITFYPGWGDESRRSVLEDDALARIAGDHDVTPAQVMLRWHLQQGRSAIPKSTNPQRIAQNLAVSGFALSDDELRQIDALDRGVRGGPDPDEVDPSTWDLEIPEA
jgi:2,5-diketo-D-gluconate reductase A